MIILVRTILFCMMFLLITRANADTFKPMDVFSLEWANDPQVSPDGRTIAYTRNGFDLMSDRRTSHIWLIEVDGNNHRPLTDQPGHSPRWSPSGDRIAFLSRNTRGGASAQAKEGSGRSSRVQLHMHWIAANRTAILTQLTQPPGSLTWSPDGQTLAFTMLVPAQSKPFAEVPKAPEGANWAPAFKVIETLIYRSDSAGYLTEGFAHVFTVPADGGTPRQITAGNYQHLGGIAWSTDGTSLYVTANRREDSIYEPSDSEIYRVPLDGGEMQVLTDRYGPDHSPTLSPNGRYLAYLGSDDEHMGYSVTNLYVLDLRAGNRRSLTDDFDRSIDRIVWDDASRGLYTQYDDRGKGHIEYLNLAGKRSSYADDLGGVSLSRPYTGGAFHSANGIVAYTSSDPSSPANLSLATTRGNTLLTNLNHDALSHKQLATIERISFPSSLDEREIEAWVAKPAEFDPDKRYPLILEIHGGPFAAYGPHFSAEVQLYVAAGYVVVYVNPRGSSSYGLEFGNLIHHAYPGDDYHDLMTAVDETIKQGWADPERLYVTGGSGGGILTAWIVTQTNRFRAAVSAKPVINWYSFVLTSDNYNFYYRYWFPDLPWKAADHYLNRSPLHFVDRVSTPTMLLSGERDYRTPISEAEQFYQALKLQKVDTALVRIPDTSHSIAARPSHLIAKTAHILAWFDRYGNTQTSPDIAHK
ncbi:MAG: S9 family peptidase [Gammaproteobacteria bacterium]|nr:MAG: S9 family peptidase [Gammaproteobacteria bacterium]